MTQTRQNSAVRTQDEQVEALAQAIGPEKIFPLLAEGYQQEIRLRALAHVQEAEARGAAEQRRKDAEGQEPVAWSYSIRGIRGTWFPEVAWNKPNAACDFVCSVRPLYDRPANVAALEARIAELQAENLKFHDLLCRAQNNVPECYEVWHVAARAALTREGGV